MAVLLGIALVCCAPDLVTGRKSYNWFGVRDDVKMGTQVLHAQLDAIRAKQRPTDTKVRDGVMFERLKRIVSRIAPVSHYPTFPYEVHLADVPVVNAWCAPGGKIMVYTGLWDPVKGLVTKSSDDELAAVLAHEIAHATARHVTESLSRNMTIMAAGQVATSAIGAASVEGGNLFGTLFSQGVDLFIPSYSRKNESEADRIGLTYMARAGYDPRAAVALWERAAAKRGDRTSIYASHPSSGVRAKQLREHLPEAIALYEATRAGKRGK